MASAHAGVPAPGLTTPAGLPVGVVHLAAEYWPYARTGGLADAVRSLANWQAAHGLRVTVLVPLHRSVREQLPGLGPGAVPFDVQVGARVERVSLVPHPGNASGPRLFFIDHPASFDRPGIYGEGADYPDNPRRFAVYCRAALAALPHLAPGSGIVHAHDWHTALAPVYLRTVLREDPYYRGLATVLSVHNAGYQGHFDRATLAEVGLPAWLWDFRWMEWYGKLNILKGGLTSADAVTTVSPTHAHELRTPDGGFGLHDAFIHLKDRLVGITNGIDFDAWNPATDPDTAAHYSRENPAAKSACKAFLQRRWGLDPEPGRPLFGMTARLVSQKGLDIILESRLPFVTEAQYLFLGAGDPAYEGALAAFASALPGRVAAEFHFTDSREHELMAGADLFLMPSLYEPCGLTQMRAQRYGAIPVARRVGGLADTIEDGVTGFLFDAYSAEALLVATQRAVDHYADRPAWTRMMHEAMGRDFSWERSGFRYLDLYRRALLTHAAGLKEG
ncbi:MAG TPA: glycogen/starch synthase [Gemmatimonadales bacterium]|nr:glycogen/starch synthase [Gemmatimonadales bacterium]